MVPSSWATHCLLDLAEFLELGAQGGIVGVPGESSGRKISRTASATGCAYSPNEELGHDANARISKQSQFAHST